MATLKVRAGVHAAGVCAAVMAWSAVAASAQPLDRRQVLDTMKRATAFMVDTVSTKGGYVWSYLPDRSRRWGEIEASSSMIWIQPPGTTTMGQIFLDAFHATGDEYYYQAAVLVARALTAAQHPSGGWHYMHDFAGDVSRAEWYRTIGRNAWRLEEFHHDWGNATFDDGGTADATGFLLRMYVEKKDPAVKAALDRAVGFILNSQYPNGAWPQRYPEGRAFVKQGKPDYTSYLTFNDDVAAGNIGVLTLCYQVLGGERVRDAIVRGMRAYVLTQWPAPQAGWALQYTPDLMPAGARTYEPKALATHATGRNVEQLLDFYRMTGERSFLARIPEALAWLDSVKLPPDLAGPGRTHPTFIEVGTNKPLYLHRRGSNVVNGSYYVDEDPQRTVGHYSSFRQVDTEGLRRRYEEVRAIAPADAVKDSPLQAAPETVPLARYFAVREPRPFGNAAPLPVEDRVASIVTGLNAEGYWLADLGSTSHVYAGDGSAVVAPGDFAQTQVGDASDTSPYRGPRTTGITTSAYIRNMGDLIRFLDRKVTGSR